MFLGMFKGRNEYGFSLVVFSFASFFMLPGLLSVSNAQSVHEKGQMKSMMAQKVSYRVLAMAPPVVISETGKPQPLEPQSSEAEAVAPQEIKSNVAVASGDEEVVPQGIKPNVSAAFGFPSFPNLFVSPPNFDFDEEDEVAPRALESQSVESQAVLPQAVPSDVDADSGAQSIVNSAVLSQGVEPETSGTQVASLPIEPQVVILPGNGASGVKSIVVRFVIPKGFAIPKGFEPVESQAVPPQAASSHIDADSGAQSIVNPAVLSQEVEPQPVGSQAIPLPDFLPQERALPAAGAEVFEPQEPAFEASPDVDAAQNAFIGPIVVNVDHNSNNSNVDVNSCCRSSLQ